MGLIQSSNMLIIKVGPCLEQRDFFRVDTSYTCVRSRKNQITSLIWSIQRLLVHVMLSRLRTEQHGQQKQTQICLNQDVQTQEITSGSC